jgi:hypothetical protein
VDEVDAHPVDRRAEVVVLVELALARPPVRVSSRRARRSESASSATAMVNGSASTRGILSERTQPFDARLASVTLM